MSEADIDSLEGNRMDEAATRAFLREQGIGVLSLADDGRAYGLPVSFGFDDRNDRLYFVFVGFGESSRKEEFATATERASFLALDVHSARDWRSAVVEGPIGPVTDVDAETVRAAFADNAWYPNVFSEAAPMRGVEQYEMRVESLTGLRGPEATRE